MRKRLLALGLAAVMTAMNCMPAMAAYGWMKETGPSGEVIWSYLNEEGHMVRNTVKKSGIYWWRLGADGHLVTGQAGTEKVTFGNGVEFEIDDAGHVSTTGKDKNGRVYRLSEFLGDEEDQGGNYQYGCWWGSDNSRFWQYTYEDGEPYGEGVHEIDGYSYYFDNEEKIKWDDRGKLINGYYMMKDYTTAVNRWIPINGKWYYFGEDGKQVFGQQTINGETYDFGTTGYVDESKVDFPDIAEIELDTSQTKAEVGDTVEIPFKIYVRSELEVASPGNASPNDADEAETEEADYELFKNAYDVSHTYRVNQGDFNTKYVEGKSHLLYEVRTKFEIDWDDQVLRFPVEYVGAVFGKLTIGNKSSESFGIVCSYPEETSAADRINDLLENDFLSGAAVDALKHLVEEKVEELKEILVAYEDILDKITSLELEHNAKGKIDTYLAVTDDAAQQVDQNKCTIIGLGFSADKKKPIGLNIGMSKEPVPSEWKDGYRTVALDLKVSSGGRNISSLSVPAIISMPKPAGIEGDEFTLYHLHGNKKEEVPYTYDGEVVKFAADEYSTYLFVEEDEKAGEDITRPSSSRNDKDDDDDSYSAKTSVPRGTWKQDSIGWWYQYTNGSYPVNEWKMLMYGKITAWYHFNEKGYMDTGWFTDKDGRIYYLNPVSNGTQGAMMTGWQTIDGFQYYFNPVSDGTQGALYVNRMTPDRHQVNEKGQRVE